MPERESSQPEQAPRLSERQARVFRALVSAYVGEAVPVGSETIAHLLPVRVSPASVRNTLAELAELGLVEKPHRSAGRVPTERGLRVYVDQLVDVRNLGRYEQRDLAEALEDAGPGALAFTASRLLSERTRQLGFVVAPGLERVVLRHVSFVRLSRQRVLAVLVSAGGTPYRRVVAHEGAGDRAALERMGALLSRRVAGRTLRQVRDQLARDTAALRSRADRLLASALALGARALAPSGEDEADLVIASRLALLDQPEFQDPERLRRLFEAIETQSRLLKILDRVLDQSGVTITFGEETTEPTLRRCALVAARYGEPEAPRGVLGVIGPSRMDYARVVPLVDTLSKLVTESLSQ